MEAQPRTRRGEERFAANLVQLERYFQNFYSRLLDTEIYENRCRRRRRRELQET